MKYIISLDQGTTSSRAILYNQQGKCLDIAQKEFTQIFPKPGWVEHNAEEIWQTQFKVFETLCLKNNLAAKDIVAVGLTNQRETAVVWDKNTGKPVYRAIVWQDRRTSDTCEQLKTDGLTAHIKKTTGLVIDTYFSATKVKWILDNIPNARKKADRGNLLFGTIDSWLVWNMTRGKMHVTDYTNASRTLMYNIVKLCWDEELLKIFGVPQCMLPKVKPSSSIFGYFNYLGTDIPIASIAGDQQAALFGQACFDAGEVKNTYGTGCFMLMNTGEKMMDTDSGLLTTIAWGLNGKVTYALEGSVFVAGAAIQWLRDGLKILSNTADSEKIAQQAQPNHGVYVVPAFAGLGTPHWDMYARGAMFGLTRGTTQADIIRATLDSLAYQTRDVLDLMQQQADLQLQTLKADGGAASNNVLMQFQADILGVNVERLVSIESTATGAAHLAGITMGIWDQNYICNKPALAQIFKPQIDRQQRENLYEGWKVAVQRVKS